MFLHRRNRPWPPALVGFAALLLLVTASCSQIADEETAGLPDEPEGGVGDEAAGGDAGGEAATEGAGPVETDLEGVPPQSAAEAEADRLEPRSHEQGEFIQHGPPAAESAEVPAPEATPDDEESKDDDGGDGPAGV